MTYKESKSSAILFWVLQTGAYSLVVLLIPGTLWLISGFIYEVSQLFIDWITGFSRYVIYGGAIVIGICIKSWRDQRE